MDRIGIFGGTFDPVHVGHLIIAEHAREQGRLDQVWFLPAARPPHKPDRTLTRFAQRVEMLQLAIAGNSAFRVEDLEDERTGPSYTVDTLEELHRRHPECQFVLVLGSDTLADLTHWYRPERIVDLVELLVWVRPDSPVPTPEELQAALGLPRQALVRCRTLDGPLVGISSSDLRQRAAMGRSLRFLVPRAIECYIEAHQLYKATRAVS